VDVALVQTGPGRYEAKFPTKEVGAYLLNLTETRGGKLVGSQVLGASVNYSPEFNAAEPNLDLLRRLAEAGGGKVLDMAVDNPFLLGRLKTFQPRDLWEAMLRLLVVLFVLDVGVRRVDVDREEWSRWWQKVRGKIGLRDGSRATAAQESLGPLLARRGQVRGTRTAAGTASTAGPLPSPDLFNPKSTPLPSDTPSAAQGKDDGATTAVVVEPPAEQAGTASRLLEAKKRAQRKR